MVDPAQVADVIRRATEIQHELQLWRRDLEAVDGPAATLAAEAAKGIEKAFREAAETLRAAAPLLTLVTDA